VRVSEQELDLGPLPDDFVEMLESERSVTVPTAAKDRVFARVVEQIGPLEPVFDRGGDGGIKGVPKIASRAQLLSGTKGIAAIAFAVGAVSGGAVVHTFVPGPRVEIVRVQVPIEVPTEVPIARPAEGPSTPPPLPKLDPLPPVAGRSRAALAAPAETARRERALIERARTALQRNEPKEALAALDEHRRRFAHGQLAEEREALMTLALFALHRTNEALDQARTFKNSYPESIFWPAIEGQVSKP
jgi:hypothetical protein